MKKMFFIIILMMFIQACGLAPAVEPAVGSQDQMSTFVAQTMAVNQSNAPVPTQNIPAPVLVTPTPALPKAPTDFKIDGVCTKITANSHKTYRYAFVGRLSWKDQSDNETGFEIIKDGVVLATLDANTTEYQDDFIYSILEQHYTVQVTYIVQSINAAGKSEEVSAFTATPCR